MSKVKLIVILSVLALFVISSFPLLAADNQVEIRFAYWRMGTEPQATIMKGIINKFEAANPDIKVVIDAIPLDQVVNILTIQSIGGAPPDIAVLPFQDVPRFVEMGAVNSLDTFLKKEPDFTKQFFNYLIPLGTINGQIYGLPHDIACNTLFYNRDLFKAAGLPDRAPKNFNEFIKFAQKLTVPSKNQFGYALGGASEAGNYSRLLCLFWASNATVIDKDEKTVLIDSPKGIAAFKRIVDLYRKYSITTTSPVELGYTPMLRMFINEQVAMMQGNIGTVAPVKKANPKMNFAVAPFRWDNYGVSMECALVFMTKASQHKEEAWKFMKYLLSFEGMRDWAVPLTYLPSRPDVVKLKEVQENPYMKAYYNEILPHARMIPRLKQSSAVMDVLFRELDLALQGKKTAETAAKDAAKSMREIIAK